MDRIACTKSPAVAQAIVALPELLEACRLIDWAGTGLAQHEPKDPVGAAIWQQLNGAVTAARAAIAKAEGSAAR